MRKRDAAFNRSGRDGDTGFGENVGHFPDAFLGAVEEVDLHLTACGLLKVGDFCGGEGGGVAVDGEDRMFCGQQNTGGKLFRFKSCRRGFFADQIVERLTARGRGR